MFFWLIKYIKNKRYVLCIPVIFLCACSKNNSPYSVTKVHMDTFVSISVYDRNKDTDFIANQVTEAFRIIEELDKKLNSYSDSSRISFINSHASKQFTGIDEEIEGIISRALAYSRLTYGEFDITIFPLVQLWDILSDDPSIPSEEEIEKAKMYTGYDNITIKGHEIFFEKSNMKIDLGGISKGYAIDKVLNYLISKGMEKVIIDAGGDLGIYINGTDSANVKIRHPRKEGDFWGSFKVQMAGVATSGDYQRFFAIDGIRYHHIIDPKNGKPGRKSVSVTIVTGSAEKADALATGVFIMGPEKGMTLIETLPDTEGIILYYARGELVSRISSGMIDLYNFKEKPIIEE